MVGMGAVGAQRESPGRLAEAVTNRVAALIRAEAVRRLWARDPALWSADDAGRREISERLGWLDSPSWLEAHTSEIVEFSREVAEAGFADVVLLGMGGSSLAPEVLERVVGVRAGCPRFAVLDSTDPEAVARIEAAVDPRRTLFIVASKSGGTIETLSHYRFFRQRAAAARPADSGRSFVAITDPESPLDRLAGEQGFRRIFRNPSDIGGRYSALSYFGMVPAGLMGQDLHAYARSSADAADASRVEEADNSALRLGALIGAAALAGADKLTLLTSDRLRPLGYWIEQLVAESTGKEGRGIVPIEGEPLGRVSDYSDDRCFVVLRLAGDNNDQLEEVASSLEAANHPVATIELPQVSAIAGEFLRWEVAVALAGAVLGINPFDQPNVQESKDRTAAILKEVERTGALRRGTPRLRLEDEIELHAGDGIWLRLGRPDSVEAAIEAFLGLARPGEYMALLTYIARSKQQEAWVTDMRRMLRDATHLPVLQGYGPRYLHSIGQLYKGGPPAGLFIQVTHSPSPDLPIPQAAWSFGVLEAAQARGDFEALDARGKPALGFHLTGEVDAGLAALEEVLSRVVSSRAVRTASS